MLKELISKSINKNSTKKSIQMGEEILTYKELGEEISKISKSLIDYVNRKNINNDLPCCGLVFGHGASGVIAILSCIMADLIYVPLDASTPKERMRYMIENSQIKILITNYQNKEFINEVAESLSLRLTILIIEDILNESGNINYLNLRKRNNSITYILYTSGSTGVPKGVIQREESIIHFAHEYINNFKINSNDNLTLLSTYGHDAAVIDIFAGILSGACLFPLDLRKPNNLFKVSNWINKNEITIWHSVPSVYRAVWKSFKESIGLSKLRYVVLGGEQLREEDYFLLKKVSGNFKLYNLYGQTESSYSSGKKINYETDILKIGPPITDTFLLVIGSDDNCRVIENNRFYDIRDFNELTQLNFEEGELLINSEFIADGYWNAKEQTNKNFISLPNLGRVYRTGDFVEIVNDCEIIYKGRRDSQIKIRGNRVELIEIESKILLLEGIRECVVLPNIINYKVDLVAFIKSNKKYTYLEINNFLKEYLPVYMLISEVIILKNIPYTISGKVDRQSLIRELKKN